MTKCEVHDGTNKLQGIYKAKLFYEVIYYLNQTLTMNNNYKSLLFNNVP